MDGGGALIQVAVHLTLPYPPSANRLWRYVGGRAIKSADYRRWLEEAAWRVVEQKPQRLRGRYCLSIHACPPDHRRRDVDNLIKPLSDALAQAGVVADDCLAQSVFAEWAGEPVKGGSIRIVLTPFIETQKAAA